MEVKDTQSFRVQQTNLSSPVTIEFSGLALHSSLTVEEITPIETGDTAQILVRLTPAHASLSGNFEYTYVVPPEIDRVTFGKENTLIWSRDGLAE